jgi:hypothetical protein
MRPMSPATAACGSRSNACTARNLSSSAGPILKEDGRGSAPCSSPTTIPMDGWSMPAALAPASGRRSWSGCGAACSRFQSTRCRSRCRRRATAASARRSSLAACIGCGPSWSPRSSISPGSMTISCARWFTRVARGQAAGRNPPAGAASETRRGYEHSRSHATAARLNSYLPRPAVKMITAPVVSLRLIGKLLANARRMRQARQTAQPAGHLAIMVAVRKRGRRLARCQSRQPAGMQKWRGGDNKFIAALPRPPILNIGSTDQADQMRHVRNAVNY